jgi:hypothetical protein
MQHCVRGEFYSKSELFSQVGKVLGEDGITCREELRKLLDRAKGETYIEFGFGKFQDESTAKHTVHKLVNFVEKHRNAYNALEEAARQLAGRPQGLLFDKLMSFVADNPGMEEFVDVSAVFKKHFEDRLKK